jgi:methylthioribose-1-phosphate isomerase
MGAGDLSDFREAGKTLFSLGLVRGSEGNLSVWDGDRLWITRTGAILAELKEEDVVEGGLGEFPQAASSDLPEHSTMYGRLGPGAIVHAHPQGSVPAGWREGEPHGVYVFGRTLREAVAEAVSSARAGIRPVRFETDRLRVLDQTLLPSQEVYLDLFSVDEVAAAIRRLAVRGAPLLGITAAYALAIEAARGAEIADLEDAGRMLVATRPTAVNIAWAVGRVLARARAATDIPSGVADEAREIEAEDAASCSAIGSIGAELVPEGANVLTHCNTGMLCTAGIGTALGVIYRAHLDGKGVHVWVDETRPVWQGARLTAWELRRLGVPMTLIPDGAAAPLMAAGRVDLVLVGADRIARNGDVANKVGTYGLAVLAGHHRVPFYVAAPTSSIDPSTRSGSEIVVEERDPAEVTAPLGLAVAPAGTRVSNPAFDVTPAALVTAIVTERGVHRPPFEATLSEAMGRGARS